MGNRRGHQLLTLLGLLFLGIILSFAGANRVTANDFNGTWSGTYTSSTDTLVNNNLSGNYHVNSDGSVYDIGTFSSNKISNTISASAKAGGIISPSGAVTVNAGSNKTFDITARSGCRILDVKVDGSSVGAVSNYTFQNINANHTIIASFAVSEPGAALVNMAPILWLLLNDNTLPNPSKTVTSAGGLIWMDRNLGASRVAVSMDDTEAYGDLYQWGRGADGHQIRTSDTTDILSSTDDPGHGDFIILDESDPYDYPFHFDWRDPRNDDLWRGESGINNPCPAGFRLPTMHELEFERSSWESDNDVGAFASPLKLVVAGYRFLYGGSLGNAGDLGFYWSSTVGGNRAIILNVGRSSGLDSSERAHGYSVRCLKDYTPPTEIKTVTSAGGQIWMDRNLGAYQVAENDSDITAYGDLYQWGRGADGHQIRASETTDILSSTDDPGHGDFITVDSGFNDWRDPQNDDLWQSESGINNPCPAGFRLPTMHELEFEGNSWESGLAFWGAFSSPLKLVTAGFRSRFDGGGANDRGYYTGYYWSSTVDGNRVRYLWFNKLIGMSSGLRANGMSVRCLKDYSPPTTIKTVTSAGGQIWMDRNLGASRLATSMDDTEAYGDLYQWGRWADGHQIRTSATTDILSPSDDPGHGYFITAVDSYPYDWRDPQNDDLWQGVLGTNYPCPAGFRLPTVTELDTERASWTSDDAAGAFASPLKFVTAGFRGDDDGSLGGTGGFYWSSTVDGSKARYLDFYMGIAAMGSSTRAAGLSVRCLKDKDYNPPTPIKTVTSAGGQIWMDRNLGASRLATSMDDTEAYGDLYQWGRGADGHQIRTSYTTDILSSTDDPGHGNFIIGDPCDWRDPQNDNLWQGKFGNNNPCPAGFRLPTWYELEFERNSWESDNDVGAFASPLKLVVAGFRNDLDGTLGYAGSSGKYWSSTVYGSDSRYLNFSSSYADVYINNRGEGFSVRCLKD